MPITGELVLVVNPTLFETSSRIRRLQLKLFELQDALGQEWLKLLVLDDCAPGKLRRRRALQQILLPYAEAI